MFSSHSTSAVADVNLKKRVMTKLFEIDLCERVFCKVFFLLKNHRYFKSPTFVFKALATQVNCDDE